MTVASAAFSSFRHALTTKDVLNCRIEAGNLLNNIYNVADSPPPAGLDAPDIIRLVRSPHRAATRRRARAASDSGAEDLRSGIGHAVAALHSSAAQGRTTPTPPPGAGGGGTSGAAASTAAGSSATGHLHHQRPRFNSRRRLAEDDGAGSSAAASRSGSGSWGFFEEFSEGEITPQGNQESFPLTRSLSFPGSEMPAYVLDESLGTQALWHATAGRRPAQPQMERAYFERQWQNNFKESKVDYTQALPQVAGKKRQRRALQVLHSRPSPFRSAATKSFRCPECGCSASLMLYISRYQVVCQEKATVGDTPVAGGDVHAEFLLVVEIGSLTFGAWKRYTEFRQLAEQLAADESKRQRFRASLDSWNSIQQKRRWVRCLESDYLTLKAFLLQRFLHNVVFESTTPSPLREFMGFS